MCASRATPPIVSAAQRDHRAAVRCLQNVRHQQYELRAAGITRERLHVCHSVECRRHGSFRNMQIGPAGFGGAVLRGQRLGAVVRDGTTANFYANSDNTLDIGTSGPTARATSTRAQCRGRRGGFFNSVLTNTAAYTAVTEPGAAPPPNASSRSARTARSLGRAQCRQASHRGGAGGGVRANAPTP